MGSRIARRAVLGAALAAALLPAGTVPAWAATEFDGTWTVRLEAQQGPCGQSRAVTVDVADGRVTYAGTENVTATGTVPQSGKVQLRFVHGADVLEAKGSVSGNLGWGSWTSPSGRCSGSWSARKSM